MTLKGYQTTSKIIKEIIKSEGLKVFHVLKIRHFTSADEALNYEHRFLKKVKAAKNDKFFNLHEGGKDFVNLGGYKLSEATKRKMRKPKSAETRARQKESLKLRSKETWKKAVHTRKNSGKVWISEKQRQKVIQFNTEYWTPEIKQAQRDRMLRYYKDNPTKAETIEKHKKMSAGASNPMYGKKHSEETKDKLRQAWVRRKLNATKI